MKTISHCLLRNGADFEIEVTAVKSLNDDGWIDGFTFSPEYDDQGDFIFISMAEEKAILERLNGV
jgi:hypothetical protein